MLKLVLDTNTLISAFFWEGNESKLFQKIEDRKAVLFINEEIITEIEDVIKRPKFKKVMLLTSQKPEDIVQKIIYVSH